MIICEVDVICQDICLLCIGLFNLMFNKIKIEIQFVCFLGLILLQIDLMLVCIINYVFCNMLQEYLEVFYWLWEEVCIEWFDGFIIIGVLVEKMLFEDVSYWDEMCNVFDWIQIYVYCILMICWGVQVVVYYFYQIFKYLCLLKVIGVYCQCIFYFVLFYLCGFLDDFCVLVF